MTLRVAILGDSAMWGTGLRREHTFAHLASSRIAAALGETLEIVRGPGAEPLRGGSRTGAKIEARTEEGNVDVLLRSGRTQRESAGDRAAFAMTFRSLFASDAEFRRFLSGEAETPAAQLFGENPAPFPTITDQVREMAARAAGPVQLVLLDGGVNDLQFEEVLDPRGPDIARINRDIEQIFGEDLGQLLRLARIEFPRAIIVVTGYYSALSQESNRDDLEELFKYWIEKPEWQVAGNQFIQDYLPILRDIWNLGPGQDVDALIEQARRRSVTAAAHAHFWMRRTIGSLPEDVAGPGVVFAYPAFRPQHAVFAGDQSLVHQGYRPPDDEEHVVSDEMRGTRLSRIPRRGLLRTYRAIRMQLLLSIQEAQLTTENRGAPVASGFVVRSLETLLEREDLPTQILVPARLVASGARQMSAFVNLADALATEIARIEIATIASFIHPNPAGARRFADRIVTEYERHFRRSVRDAVRGMARPGESGVRLLSLREHGVDPRQGLRQLAQIAFVDSVAVQLRGLVNVTGRPFPGVTSLRTRMTLGARVTFEVLIPIGATAVFRAFDTTDDVQLADITELTLGDWPFEVFSFDEVELFINGRSFFRGRRDEARTTAHTVTFQIGR